MVTFWEGVDRSIVKIREVYGIEHRNVLGKSWQEFFNMFNIVGKKLAGVL